MKAAQRKTQGSASIHFGNQFATTSVCILVQDTRYVCRRDPDITLTSKKPQIACNLIGSQAVGAPLLISVRHGRLVIWLCARVSQTCPDKGHQRKHGSCKLLAVDMK